MTVEALTLQFDRWISEYIAIACLISIVAWGVGVYLWTDRWERSVRDCGVFLVSIGVLTVLLALREEGPSSNVLDWRPFVWFCFSMLVILEVLWISVMLEAAFRAVRAFPEWYARRARGEEPRPSPYEPPR